MHSSRGWNAQQQRLTCLPQKTHAVSSSLQMLFRALYPCGYLYADVGSQLQF